MLCAELFFPTRRHHPVDSSILPELPMTVLLRVQREVCTLNQQSTAVLVSRNVLLTGVVDPRT
jgi:hypothetical protein